MYINDIEVKIDSAEKLAAIVGKPTQNYLFSEEFNAVVAKVKELSTNVNDYNPNGYLIPPYYVHNWTQAGEPPFNLVHPTNAGNSRNRMEAPGLGSAYYIHFFFNEPVLITEMYYCNGSIAINDGSVKQFKLLGSTSVKSNSFPLTLHDSTIGEAEMEASNHTSDFFEPFKKIILTNPLTVTSLRFEAHTIYPGGATRPRVQKILFK